MRARALAVIGVALLPVTAPQEAGAREEATRGVVDSVEPTGKVASDLGVRRHADTPVQSNGRHRLDPAAPAAVPTPAGKAGRG